MEIEELIQKCIRDKRRVCLVGAGGKTSLMFYMAKRASLLGRRVLVTTSTHIIKPDHNYAEELEAVFKLWESGTYAVIGRETSGNKLVAADDSLYKMAAEQADLVLIEADGSKRKPCKLPAGHEPVIADDCDLVIGLMGMTAIGEKMDEVCFRYESKGQWLNQSTDTHLSPELAARILCDERGTRKGVDNREYVIVLSQCENALLTSYAEKIRDIIRDSDNIPVVCNSLDLMKYMERENE